MTTKIKRIKEKDLVYQLIVWLLPSDETFTRRELIDTCLPYYIKMAKNPNLKTPQQNFICYVKRLTEDGDGRLQEVEKHVFKLTGRTTPRW